MKAIGTMNRDEADAAGISRSTWHAAVRAQAKVDRARRIAQTKQAIAHRRNSWLWRLIRFIGKKF